MDLPGNYLLAIVKREREREGAVRLLITLFQAVLLAMASQGRGVDDSIEK